MERRNGTADSRGPDRLCAVGGAHGDVPGRPGREPMVGGAEHRCRSWTSPRRGPGRRRTPWSAPEAPASTSSSPGRGGAAGRCGPWPCPRSRRSGLDRHDGPRRADDAGTSAAATTGSPPGRSLNGRALPPGPRWGPTALRLAALVLVALAIGVTLRLPENSARPSARPGRSGASCPPGTRAPWRRCAPTPARSTVLPLALHLTPHGDLVRGRVDPALTDLRGHGGPRVEPVLWNYDRGWRPAVADRILRDPRSSTGRGDPGRHGTPGRWDGVNLDPSACRRATARTWSRWCAGWPPPWGRGARSR